MNVTTPPPPPSQAIVPVSLRTGADKLALFARSSSSSAGGGGGGGGGFRAGGGGVRGAGEQGSVLHACV